jgi:hypothetical protein
MSNLRISRLAWVDRRRDTLNPNAYFVITTYSRPSAGATFPFWVISAISIHRKSQLHTCLELA